MSEHRESWQPHDGGMTAETLTRETGQLRMPETDFYRQLVNEAPVKIWTTNAKGEYIFANKAWMSFLGEEFSRDWVSLVDAEDRDALEDRMEACRREGTPIRMDVRIRVSPESFRWIHLRCVARLDPQQRFTGYIGTAVDITANHERKAALSRRHSLLAFQSAILRKILSSPPENPRLPERKILSFLSEVTGAKFAFLFLPAEQSNIIELQDSYAASEDIDLRLERHLPRLESWARRAIQEQPQSIPLGGETPDAWVDFFGSEEGWLLTAPVTTETGLPNGLIAVVLEPDAVLESAWGFVRSGALLLGTALDRTNQQRSIRRLADYSERSPIMLLEFDAEGELQYANNALKHTTRELGYHNELDVPGRDLIRRILQDESTELVMEETVTHAGRTFNWIFQPGICPSSFLAYGFETTREVDIARQLQESVEREKFGGVLGQLGHEFTSLLGAIRGLIDLSLNSPEIRMAPSVEKHLLEIESTAQRGAMLSRQLTAVDNPDKFERAPCDLNSLLLSVQEFCLRSAGPGVDIRLQLSHNLPKVSCNSTMFERALCDVILNAVEATEEKGWVCISSEVHHPGRGEAPQVVISVQDSGPGVDPAIRDRVFTPLYTTKDRELHAGLGLSVARNIIHLHEGELRLEPAAKKEGALFTITLPTSMHEDNTPDPYPVAPTPEHTILVVEDHPLTRRITGSLLETLGQSVYLASGYEEALALWRQHRGEIDILLCDVVLDANHNGPELVRLVSGEKPDLAIAYMSGYGQIFAQENFDLPPDSIYMQKPYSRLDLLNLLRQLSRGGQLQKTA